MTNAPSIEKLEGPGYQFGGSAGIPIEGVPLAFGGDLNIIPDKTQNKTYLGLTANAGFGSPGIEFHGEECYTGTLKISKINIFELAEAVYVIIMEW